MTKIQFTPGRSDKPTLLSKDDLYLFNEGTHFHLYDKFGAHPLEHEGAGGTYFAVWAPNAEEVSVIGTFNDWQKGRHRRVVRSGVSEIDGREESVSGLVGDSRAALIVLSRASH